EDGIRDDLVTGVQTCALPISDFVVLEQDPLGVPLKQLKDVAVWGTVFEGKKHPARQATGWDERPKRLVDRPSGSTVRHVSGLFEIGRASCRESVAVWAVGGGV